MWHTDARARRLYKLVSGKVAESFPLPWHCVGVAGHRDGLITVYAHNQINLVRVGQTVRAGQTIAKVGQTGRTTGAHLHFEVRRGVKPVNPLGHLPP